MAHIAIFLMPERGHVLPVLGLIAELVRRGHRVSCPVTESFVPAVTSCGATPIPYETTFVSRLPESLYTAAEHALVEAESTLPALEDVFRADRPDILLWDIVTWAGGVTARRLGVPDLLVDTILASNPRWSLGTAAMPTRAFDPHVIDFFTRVHAFIGCPLPEFITGARKRIALFPREFQPEGDTFDDWFAFTGPCLTDRSFQGAWSRRTPPS